MLTIILKKKIMDTRLLTAVKTLTNLALDTALTVGCCSFIFLFFYFLLWNTLYTDVFAFVIADMKLKSSASLDNQDFPLCTVYSSSLFDIFLITCVVFGALGSACDRKHFITSLFEFAAENSPGPISERTDLQQFNQAMVEKLKADVINIDLGLLYE